MRKQIHPRTRLSLFALSLLLPSCLPSVRQTASPLPPTATRFDSAVADGITVTAMNARVENPYFVVDICYNRPSEADWSIHEATLRFDERQIPLSGTANLCGYKPPCASPMTRCDALRFPLARPGANAPPILEAFTISIHSIAADPQQGEICSQPFLDLLQRELASRNTRISVSTECDAHQDRFVVTNKPADMSMEEAQAIIDKVYLEVIGRQGPWVLESRGD